MFSYDSDLAFGFEWLQRRFSSKSSPSTQPAYRPDLEGSDFVDSNSYYIRPSDEKGERETVVALGMDRGGTVLTGQSSSIGGLSLRNPSPETQLPVPLSFGGGSRKTGKEKEAGETVEGALLDGGRDDAEGSKGGEMEGDGDEDGKRELAAVVKIRASARNVSMSL